MLVHEEGFREGSSTESLGSPRLPWVKDYDHQLNSVAAGLMHREEPLRFFNLRNFRSYVEADEGRNQQFAGDVIPTGRLIELCK
jgi:hypothetical protein